VLSTYPDCGLVIIGSGSLEASLRAEIASKPYSAEILLCGDVPHPVTMRAIAEADMLLRTTLYDGDAVSVREALHLGTTVIATDNGMRPAGCDLIPIGDTEALALAIIRRLDGGSATSPAVEDDQSNLQSVLELYQDVLR
jgi:glycosyltransferase involved in cell wall biosynthesis